MSKMYALREEAMDMDFSWQDGHTSPMEVSSGEESFSLSTTKLKIRSLMYDQHPLEKTTSTPVSKAGDENIMFSSDVFDSIMNENKKPEPELGKKRVSMSAVVTSNVLTKRKLKRHSDIGLRANNDVCEINALHSGLSSMRSLGKSRASRNNINTSHLDESYVQAKAGCLKQITFLVIFCCLVLFLSWLHIKNSSYCDTKINIAKLKQKLTANVFGQHIAIELLTSAIEEYQNDEKNGTNKKPLVLSFHGWTGVGKNYISKLIQEAADFHEVISFLVPLHFAHPSKDLIYEKDIQEWVTTNVSSCGRTLFIIDEMDKASIGVLSGFLAAISEMSTKTKEDMQVIFLILSNAKSAKINEFLFKAMSHGRDRESISYNELLTIFHMGHEKEWYHKFLDHSVIDVYVPFLPLSQEHVKQCIRRNLKMKGANVDEELVDEISTELMYFTPHNLDMKFSLTGCKRVSDKVDLHIFD